MNNRSALSSVNGSSVIGALLLPALLFTAPPSLASAPATAASPVQSGATAADTVQTPMDDLNLSKREIPPALVEAEQNPYSTEGLGQCAQITVAVEALNTAIGDDIDLPREGGVRLSASDLADFAASTFIPFRDIIRTVTGANARKRRLQEAVLAGFARRSFLKGLGVARRCAYPASPATPQIIAAKASALNASLEALCGNFEQQSPREQYLNRRKCMNYRNNTAGPTTEPANPAPKTGAK
jgi:hypothetical protein